ncbi:MAG: outer membrane beta-barrel protein [Paludibacteraceae bacterium]|nr:outer membrane beta-barrel protein [Paludibacteraceae bacterium]
MKKMLLIAAMALATVAANAQWWVGGSLGYTFNTENDKNTDTKVNTHDFTIAPEVGYDLNENWSVAAAIGYNYHGNSDANNTGLFIKPYVRYNVIEFGPVQFFLDGQLGYEYATNAVNTKTNTFGLGVAPGISIAAGENLGFVAHLGQLGWNLESYKTDFPGAKSVVTNSFGFDFTSYSLNIGVYYKF